MNTIVTYQLIIKGKVQDVGFRQWFKNLAISYGLTGYVRNLSNKKEVEAIIQGDLVNILKIAKISKVGTKLALVKSIISNKIFNQVKYTSFIIKY